MQRILFCVPALLLMPLRAAEMTPVGDWKTIDDKTGKEKSIVRIYEQDGELFGKVEKILDPTRAEGKCIKCTDERKDQPVLGMIILRHMKKNGNEYSGGDILDPEEGKVYRCKVKTIDNGTKLSVRGYIGVSMLGRSQTWTRWPASGTPGI